jgi:hypothetical protein
LESELSSLRNELRTFHSQTITANNKARSAEIELQLLKEREASWKAEKEMMKVAADAPNKSKKLQDRLGKGKIASRARSESPSATTRTHPKNDDEVAAASKYLDSLMVRQSQELDAQVIEENIDYLERTAASRLQSRSRASADASNSGNVRAGNEATPYWKGAGIVVLDKNKDRVDESVHNDTLPVKDRTTAPSSGHASFLGFLERSKSVGVGEDGDATDSSQSPQVNPAVPNQRRQQQIFPPGNAGVTNTESKTKPPAAGRSSAKSNRPATSHGKLRFDRLQNMYSRVLGRGGSDDSSDSDSGD